MYDNNQHVRSVGSSHVTGTTAENQTNKVNLQTRRAFTPDIMQVTDMEGWGAAAGVLQPRRGHVGGEEQLLEAQTFSRSCLPTGTRPASYRRASLVPVSL